jgi:hypothetical protein
MSPGQAHPEAPIDGAEKVPIHVLPPVPDEFVPDAAGRLLRVGDGIVLLPGADESAVTLLGELPQPFTTGQARARLGTSRRVVLPLLAHLDRLGHTRRLPDDRRTTEPRGGETHGGTTQEGAT